MDIQLIQDILQVCVIPLLGVLTAYIVQYLRAKSNELKNIVDNDLAKKYIDMVTDTITSCVIATNQTFTDSLKTQDKFDAEAQEKAFNMTFEAVMSILSADAKKYLEEMTGDLNTYLRQNIEAEVNRQKIK